MCPNIRQNFVDNASKSWLFESQIRDLDGCYRLMSKGNDIEVLKMLEKFSYSVAEAEMATGIHHRKILRAIKDKRLAAKLNGREKIILKEDLKTWLDELPSCETEDK